jgi:hypothetical protein
MIDKWEKKNNHRGYPNYTRKNSKDNQTIALITMDFYNNCWELLFIKKIKDHPVSKSFICPQDAALYADIVLINSGHKLKLPMFFTY